jgi:UDP-glucose 4-epimerase
LAAKHSVALIGAGSNAGRAFGAFVQATGAPVSITAIVRPASQEVTGADRLIRVSSYGDVSADELAGHDSVINMLGSPKGSDAELMALNADLAVKLAISAKAAGVSQFVQLSSLSIFGRPERITSQTALAPVDGYGRSKAAAEVALTALAGDGLNVTLVRLPVLYNANSENKIVQLARLVCKTGVLPISREACRRSILHTDNLAAGLCSLIVKAKAGPVFLADPGALDMPHFGALAPRKVRNLQVPSPLLFALRRLAPGLYVRLFQSSLIDPDACYRPEGLDLISAEEGLRSVLAALSDPDRKAKA